MKQSAPCSVVPTDRDIAIVLMVYYYNGVTINLLKRRFWPHSESLSKCYSRVSQLIAAGYLQVSFSNPLSYKGSTKRFLIIGPLGRQLVAQTLGLSRSQLNRTTRMIAPFLIAHHLCICEFRLSLELATEQSSIVRLVEWISEERFRRSPIKVIEKKELDGMSKELVLSTVPDGAFVLATRDGTKQSYYLEQDNGTVSISEFKEKIRTYILHLKRLEFGRPVIIVIPNQHRLDRIAEWVMAEAASLSFKPDRFLLTTKAEISELTILSAPIYQPVGAAHRQPLVPELSHPTPPLASYQDRHQLYQGVMAHD